MKTKELYYITLLVGRNNTIKPYIKLMIMSRTQRVPPPADLTLTLYRREHDEMPELAERACKAKVEDRWSCFFALWRPGRVGWIRSELDMVHLWNFDNEIGALNGFTAMISVSIRMRVRTISVCPIVSMGYKCSTYAHRRTSLVGSHSGSCFRYRSTRNSASRSNHYVSCCRGTWSSFILIYSHPQ